MRAGFKVQDSPQRRNNIQNKSLKNILATEKETETLPVNLTNGRSELL